METLATTVAQAEFVMNSRPIAKVSTDLGDENALTPMHFLCPGIFAHSRDEVLPPTPPDAACLRYTWRQSRALVDSFWRRWSRDYVSALQARPKWREVEPNLVIGDLVLLVDDQRRRGDWRLGTVVSTDGEDIVRTVEVKTTEGKVFSRDRTKVVRLELDPARVSAP